MGCCGSSTRVNSSNLNSRKVPENFDAFEGISRPRQCTDVIFAILFFCFLFVLVCAVGVAAAKGDPRQLLYGYDDYGNVCGIKNSAISGVDKEHSGKDMTNKTYLTVDCEVNSFPCKVKKRCEKSCPDGFQKTTYRRCVKNSTTEPLKFSLTWFEEIGSDIALCWREIVILCVISLGLSVLLLIIFRFCAAIIIWIILAVVTIAAIAITIFIWVMWNKKKKEAENLPKGGAEKELKTKQVTYWLVAAIATTIFTVIYLLIIIFMRKRIKLVAALFQEAGKAVSAMPFILIQPVWTFLLEALACFFLLISYLFIQTAGDPVLDENGYVSFTLGTFFQVMRWYSLFAFLWVTQYILACQHLIIAGAVSLWYFTRDKRRLKSPLLRSLKNIVRYHLGSAAVGSLIIAIMKAIRALFRLLEKYLNDQGQRCQIFWKIFQCCLACFESYLKFLSRNAYIMIAIYGQSFCQSARQAFALLTANCLRVAAINCIGDFILFVGKLGVTITIAFIGIEIVRAKQGVHYTWVPVALSCLFAFIAAHCFLSVYEMAIDTLLLCFCEDCEKNDGVHRPYFMSRSLMVFVENSNKVPGKQTSLKGKDMGG